MKLMITGIYPRISDVYPQVSQVLEGEKKKAKKREQTLNSNCIQIEAREESMSAYLYSVIQYNVERETLSLEQKNHLHNL